ncbi:pyocin knob domain-containing protein [Bacillus pumilus]|uniref:pyocin knob domain-containing protein n=1 Tax=Bacillus pumilus TaxID=1408 RepID=UPI0021B37DF7|nr:pyocin knob domain-containing protein [Bacillus pumilus]
MDIKSPKVFETSDKAHADLFNEMVKVLLKNDTGLLDQLGGHINDTKPHASEAEKKKWNESQLYKITADDGKHLIAVPADGSIFNAIKDKGMCTFVAYPGVEDSPAPSNAYLRGIQTVGQNNIGTGFAIDTSGNAYYFYYNSSHISITWTQLPTTTEKDKWNNGQLFRLTQNNGKPIYKGTSETTDYNEITDTGFYLIYNKGVNGPPSTNASFMIVISYTSTLIQATYSTDGKKSHYRIRKANSAWTEWTRVLTEEDKIPQSEIDKWNNGQLYKLTPDDGKVKRLPNGTDIFKLPTGPYMGAQLLNVPVQNDGSFYYVDVFETGYEQNGVIYKRIIATRSFDNITWIGTFHAQGFRGWERVITSGDAKLDWKFPTIRNGWKTYKSEVNNDYRVRVAKDAMGTVYVRGAIAGGTLGDAPAFTLPEGCEPPFPHYNLGVASSTGGFKGPQYSRQYVAPDGRFCIQDTTSNKDFIVVNCMFKAKE